MTNPQVLPEKDTIKVPPLCRRCAHPIDAAGAEIRDWSAAKGWHVVGGMCSACIREMRFQS
jgi:hypothetical protein